MADAREIPIDELPSTDEGWRERLDPLQFEVARKGGTERAFTGIYWDTKDHGTYRCVACEQALFSSDTKYDSGSGWPSFWEPLADDKVTLVRDVGHGMVRTEVRCAALRLAPGSRVRGRPPADGPALLHELGEPRPRPRRRHRARRLTSVHRSSRSRSSAQSAV